MKYRMIIISVMISSFAIAQQTINVDDPNNRNLVNLGGINGEPVNMFKYTRVVEGSVFIPADFTRSTILIKNNKRPINNVKARLNIVEHTLHYLDEKGNEYFTRLPIEEIFFKDTATGDTRIFSQTLDSCANDKPGWYEVLEKGNVSLFMEIIKTVTENKPYGSATTEQKVTTYNKFWMRAGAGCRQVNKINDFIDELKKINPGFESSVAGQKYSGKKTEDWITVARKFNALQ
jgi:hypothetical protein